MAPVTHNFNLQVLAISNDEALIGDGLNEAGSGVWYQAGDALHGYQIVDVKLDQVIFQHQGRNKVVRINVN